MRRRERRRTPIDFLDSQRLRRAAAAFILALAGALGSSPASAQFGTSYDPDFAPELSTGPAAAPAAAEPPEPVRIILPAPVKPPTYQLLPRADQAHVLEPETSTAAAPGAEPAPVMSVDRFRQVSAAVDRGEKPGEGGIETPETPTVTETGAVAISTNAPKPPPPEIELPTYGTSLSVTGRKLIGFNYSMKEYTHDQTTTGRPKTTDLIAISQQLQLRMQGKVGPKITVNVDYDDSRPNQQDISVVYQGDPSETVQNVSFGDIDLSLPSTEFVSYNKQLFGIRADVKWKGFKFTVIGSRTKGTTKTKQFRGNSQFVAEDIIDTAYVRRTYYDLTFGNQARLPIRSGTEHIYLATQALGVVNSNQQQLTVDDLDNQINQSVTPSTFTGYFQILAAGIDYTINYAKGYIQLRTAAQPQYVLAVDFIDASGNELRFERSSGTTLTGGSGLFKLVKTPSDIPLVSSGTEVGWNRELKTFYSFGQTSIVPDNGQGNFSLQLLNTSRQPIGATLNPLQLYPATINVDFTNGIFNLTEPFSVSNSSPTTPDPNIYAPVPITSNLFHAEFNYRFKTFTLEPNLVTQSEIVVLDGQKLTRNVDYFIDYTGGFLTFFNPQRINANSEIDITYEVQAFAGASNDTLLGGRASYNFTDNVSLGSTILYDAGAKPTITPQITELAKSMMVYDFDAQAKKLKIGNHLNVSLSAEFAQSKTDPNLNPYAIIDNMESILQQIPASTAYTAWKIAANPTGVISDPTLITWYNESVPTLQVNPNAQATSAASTNVLDVQYSFNGAENQETSIVIPLSNTGLDMSQSSTLQVVMLGDNSGNSLNFHLGSINEDVDGTGGMTLYCANGQVRTGAPKTEDLACTGILQPGEDIGWCYAYGSNPCALRYGANNGVIDTEDLNANGLLDPADLSGGDYGYSAQPPNNNLYDATANEPLIGGAVNWTAPVGFPNTNWHTLQIPLNISSTTATNWTTIKQLRISIKNNNGPNGICTTLNATSTCIMKFATINVLGNSWLQAQPGDPDLGTGAVAFESMTVIAINNINNPNYVPIYNAGGDAETVFNELYGSVAALQQQTNTQNIQEQALELNYTGLTNGATIYTKRIFANGIDISQHHEFNFLLYGNAQTGAADVSGGQVFFLRAGADQSFFEIQVPITFTGWKLIHLKQTDPGNGIMNNWVSDMPGTVIVSSNSPTLQNVGELVAGMYGRPGMTSHNGTVYLDEIFLSQPAARTGNAEKVQADFEVPGWSTFGYKYRSVDANFQTPTSVVSNQSVATQNFYLNLTHYPWLPVTFNVSKTVTNTPATIDTGNLSNLVSLLQEGKVTTLTETGRANVAYGAYPRLNLSYTRTLTNYDLLSRQDDRSVYATTLQYGFPTQKSWVPRTLDMSYSFTDYDVLYQSDFSRAQTGDYDATEHDFSYGTRMTFVPWKGSSFNPTWSMTNGSERRTDYTSGAPVDSEYPKVFQQDAGFSSNWKINSWLNPQVNYTMETISNTILNVSTYVVNNTTYTYNPGDLKNVTRTANGSVSIPINFGDVFPRSAALKSLSVVTGYQLQDGDSWSGVNQSEPLEDLFSVRQPLHPSAAAAQLVSLTERDTFSSTQRWSPFQYYNLTGRALAWKSLSISNNFVETIQHSNVTGTASETITQTPIDTVISLSKLETLFGTSRWMSNAQLDFKYSLRTTDNVNATFDTQNTFGTDLRMLINKKYDTSFSYNFRTDVNRDLVVDANTADTIHQDADAQVTFDYKKFRFTPKMDFTFDQTSTGGVKTNETTVITPSLLARADLSLPAGLRLPGSSRPLLFTNRIIWTTTLSIADTTSPVVQENNSILGSLTTSADYELAKNLRMTLNGTLQRLWHQYLLQENYISYSLGTNLTFQF